MFHDEFKSINLITPAEQCCTQQSTTYPHILVSNLDMHILGIRICHVARYSNPPYFFGANITRAKSNSREKTPGYTTWSKRRRLEAHTARRKKTVPPMRKYSHVVTMLAKNAAARTRESKLLGLQQHNTVALQDNMIIPECMTIASNAKSMHRL